MQKSRVIAQIVEYLVDEAGEARRSGDSERLREMERLQVLYRFLPNREYGPEDVIVPSALVSLELDGTTAHYFIAPQGGGLITQIDGKPVQVITPQSPLGEALLGKKLGDVVEVVIREKTRRYTVRTLS
jgi:transcription elongation GreA/GreB family factor